MKIHTFAGALALSASLTAQWQETTPASSPAGRAGHGMACDPSSGDVVVFGGDTFAFPAGPTNQTWRYDGATWTNANPATSPPASVGVSLVYDSNRAVFVTYGSLSTSFFGGPSADRTWEYDPLTNAWSENVLLTTTPGGLGLYGMSFDSVVGRTVLYGGLPDNFFPIDSDQTWEYDGNDWTLVTTTGNPGPLERPGMCFHAGIGRSVVFGGIDVQTGGNDDVWLYQSNGNGTGTWSTAIVTGPRPTVRTGCRLVYDSARQVCVLTGGQDPNNGTPFGDTWELTVDGAGNGAGTQVTSAYTNARLDAGRAFVPTRRQVVMFGCSNFVTFQAYGDTWEYGAKSRTFGNGCPGSNGVPTLDAADAPRFGENYVLDVGNLNTSVNVAFVALSLSDIPPTPLDVIGMTGCTAYVLPVALATVTGSAGSASLSTAMPTTVGLLGTSIFSQALSLDPQVNAAWLTASNAHEGTLGG